MNRILQILSLLIVLTGIGMILSYSARRWKTVKKEAGAVQPVAEAPNAGTMASRDRELAKRGFEHPESLDIQPVPSGQPAVYADLSARPPLLSERQTGSRPEKSATVEPARTNRPAFMDTFASLRKGEVRNPDSGQNRAAVISIMKKRQNRVSRLEKRVELYE